MQLGTFYVPFFHDAQLSLVAFSKLHKTNRTYSEVAILGILCKQSRACWQTDGRTSRQGYAQPKHTSCPGPHKNEKKNTMMLPQYDRTFSHYTDWRCECDIVGPYGRPCDTMTLRTMTTNCCWHCVPRSHSNSDVISAEMGGSSSKLKLSKEDMDFLMENTNFTKKQIKAWYSGFMVIDCVHLPA